MRAEPISNLLLTNVVRGSRVQQLELAMSLGDSFVTETYRELLHDLKNADFVCEPCGSQFSTPRSSSLMATCHVGYCDLCKSPDVTVTSVRHYGYLADGIRAVEHLLKERAEAQRKATRESRIKTRRVESMEDFKKLCEKSGL